MKISIGTSVFQGRILFIESYITYPAKVTESILTSAL